jgi:uncharacterized protein (TIGR03435 family)
VTIIDKTGIEGGFDFTLNWTPDPTETQNTNAAVSIDPAGPSIFTAIQEQLGLKLESTKTPVDVILIDSVQKPTEN